ncbi:MAG: DNA polymerase I [Chloroflexi bacterium]|nr:DNA polymerase I [Chloroflexota bacterium]
MATKANQQELLVLVDGNALIHRAFHAVPGLTTTRGELTNATFGFATMLLKVLGDFKPDYATVAFDLAAPTFRHEAYAEYKAHRPRMDDGLRPQFGRVRELLDALGIGIYECPGLEADDLLGILARQARERGLEVLIVTGDTDALQLVEPGVRVLMPRRGMTDTSLYDEVAVRERYGLEPHQLTDYKALCGDTSDNIAGVSGIGAKTATKLLTEFGSIESLLADREKLAPKIKAAIDASAEQLVKNKMLVTIVRAEPDKKVQLDLEQARVGDYDRQRVAALFQELEFRSLLTKLPESTRAAPATGRRGPVEQMSLFGDEPVTVMATTELAPTCTVVNDADLLAALVADLQAAETITVDTETDSLDSIRSALVGLSLSTGAGKAYYVPVGHVGDGQPDQLPVEVVVSALRSTLADPARPKWGHNLKYDVEVLTRHGLPVAGLALDTMLAAHLLESTQRSLSLKDLAWYQLNIEMTPITDLIGTGKKQISMAQVPIVDAANYACADAEVAHRLGVLLSDEVRKAGLWHLLSDVEMPLLPVIAEMEMAGIALDVPYLTAMSTELHEKINELILRIYEAVGHKFNINSTQQLGQVLFGELKLPGGRRTKTGYSTDAATLENLRGAHEIVDLLLEYRQLVKLKSTYVDALPALLNPETNRVHTSFNQTGAATGRLSSSNPNLQNIPVRTDLGRRIRRAFVAAPGFELISADYSQIEMRILASVAGDERLLAAFRNDEDVHSATAAGMYGVPIEQVTGHQRNLAKTINYAVTYGAGERTVALNAGISREEARQLIDDYYEKYASIRRYLDETKAMARRAGYVQSLLGRRRYFPEINSSDHQSRAQAERQAINAPIQATASDIVKIAMVKVDRALKSARLRTQMLLQVHDELLFEGPPEEVEEAETIVSREMESAFELEVPLKVEVHHGSNWADIH